MVQRTKLWAVALATAALISLPFVSAAQSSASGPSGQTAQGTSGQSGYPSSSAQSSSTDENSPRFHLDEARKVLDQISTSSLSGEPARQIAQIKTSFSNLYNDYTRSSSPSLGSGFPGASTSATGTSGSSSGSNSMSPDVTDWRTEYTQISQMLDRLNVPASSSKDVSGGGSAYGSGSTSGTSGGSMGSTSGTTGSTGGYGRLPSLSSATIDPPIRSKLADFRKHLDKFHELAMQGASGAPSMSGSLSGSPRPGPPERGSGAIGTSGSAALAGASRYLDDIDNIVNQALNASPSASSSNAPSTTGSYATGTSGSSQSSSSSGQRKAHKATDTVRLSRDQLEQIKQDVARLRQQIGG